MFVTCFRPRDNHIRTIISLLIADKLISDLGVHSEQGIVYIFSKEKFNWTEQEYSTFKAISTCTRGLGTMMMTPFLKMMSVSDPIISYLGILSSTVSYYLCGLSIAPWMLWMAATLGSFRSMTTAVARWSARYAHKLVHNEITSCRSMASKLVEKNESANGSRS